MPDSPGRSILPWISLFIIWTVWGSTFLGMAAAVETIPPFMMTGGRFLMAAPILIALGIPASARGNLRITWPEIRSSAMLGVILLVGGPGLVGFAQTELDSSLAALIASTSPIWMALFTAAQTHRRPNPQVFGALIMGIIGIGVMLGGPGDSVPLVPALLVLVSALFWSSGTVLSRTMPLPRSPFMATGLQLLFGGLGLNVVAGVRGEYAEFAFADISGRSWIGFAWLVIGGSLIAYSAYMYANASLPIEIVSTYAYVNPVIAVVLGAMFDNDATGPNVLIGGAIILLAVIFIVSGHIIHRQRPHPGA